jgi:3-hydroxybutyryl-CoA dehydrogenase
VLRGWVVVRRTQDLRQLVRTELARSTGAVGEVRELDGFHSVGRYTTYDARHTTIAMLRMSVQGDEMRIAVIGGGTMGIGIAHRFAVNGAEVAVVDVDLGTARVAVERAADTLAVAATRGKLDPNDLAGIVDNIHAVGSVGGLDQNLDLIVEAVVEDVALKQSILYEAEKRTPVVLASNTSSISIDVLAHNLRDPRSFAGMHFFNPVWAMHVVEVIRGSHTSVATLERIDSMVDFLGMEQALINDAPGFATSRLGVLVGIEAIRMVQEGVAEPADIDRAMSLGYRHPMGPLMLGDLVGLDVRLKIASHLASVYGDRFEPPELLTTMVAEGKLGRKTGIGFYDWTSGSAVPV